MKLFVRIATVIGIAYLLVAGGLFMGAAQEARVFHRTAPVIEGTVERVSARGGSGLLSRLRLGRPPQLVIISYTHNGVSGMVSADMPARRHIQVGSKVELVGIDITSPDPLDHVVSVKGQGLRTLQALPLLFWFAAGLVTWVALLRVVPWRKGASSKPTAEFGSAEFGSDDEDELAALQQAPRKEIGQIS